MTDKEKRDAAVDAFAAAIKDRLDQQAAKGYSGWDGAYPTDKMCCELEEDVYRFRTTRSACLAVDIGARAMMLHFRGGSGKPASVLPEPAYPDYSKSPEIAAVELLDGAYDVVELWSAKTPAQAVWKKAWMAKARELGATPSW